ncbi:dihydroneopterin aldolase [Aestuariibius sp. HNIBRBA575]|uniref:dihydroneopterin aldolase n=1 Tax=Aestuariibius sp. HNIBRBA575 TaxID=3233343 RepID=UPI0034A4C924
MSNTTRTAFDPLLERAKSMASSPAPLDRISLRDYVVEVEIGAFQLERDVMQRVKFNVVVEVGAVTDPLEDDVDRILSYDRVSEAIDAELAAERLNLLETLAENVADRILLEPQAQRVFVRIEKVDRGPYALGVEIVRDRGHLPNVTSADPLPRPRIVSLSHAAIAAGYLPNWIDQLTASDDTALILIAGPVAQNQPQVSNETSQKRIDLLAYDVNAWVIAAQDDRCKVVDSRTELDWAMRNGQISVWAPSKMVLDAVDGPGDVRDTDAITAWFVDLMGASALISIGNPNLTLKDETTPKISHPVQKVLS